MAHEPDSFGRALPDRLESDFVRIGPGDEPARVEQAVIGNLTVSLISFGFPVRSRIESSGTVAAVGRILRAPAGARWGDTELVEGQNRSLGPKNRHLGVNPAGVSTLAVVFDADLLRDTADLLGFDVAVDNMVGPLAASRQLDRAFGGIEAVISGQRAESIGDETRIEEGILGAIARAARQDDDRGEWSRSFAMSEVIVDRCLEFTRSTSTWQPSTVELSRAAGMSERRVRSAFQDVTSMAPIRYLRLVALNRARTVLRRADRDSTTVIRVAEELGFYHPSRFARGYRALFGEAPSHTLRA